VGASADKISIKGGAVGSAANETKIYSGTGTFGQANTGFYLDSGGDFSLGNKLTWDNSSSLLSIEGDIGGTIGQIAVGDKVRITPAGIFGLSGVELPGDAANNFQLRASDGKLIAKSADIEGNITATTGTFAGSLVAAGGTFGSVSISSTGSLTVGTNITINNTDGIKGTNGTTTAFQLNPNGTGSIGGFNYGLSSITSTNLTLSSGASPYLYFGQDTSPAYGDVGAFLGIVSSTPKFSLVSGSAVTDGFLKYDPNATYDLEIGGNAKIGPLILDNINKNTTATTSFNTNSYSATINTTTTAFTGSLINSASFSIKFCCCRFFKQQTTLTIFSLTF
jgi:hypothetical protein